MGRKDERELMRRWEESMGKRSERGNARGLENEFRF